MISYQTYFKDTRGFSGIPVPHLYEHAFLNSVTDRYTHAPYVSFSNATTQYRGGIFISFVCFNDQYASEVARFIAENSTPTDDQIKQALLELNCEELGLYKVISKTRLHAQLNELAAQPWQPVTTLPFKDTTDSKVLLPRVLSFHADSSEFKRLTVSLTLSDQSPEDSTVFSYLSNGLLSEVLLHELRIHFAARREVAQLVADDYRGRQLTQTSTYIVPNTTKRAGIEAVARERLQSFTEPQNFHYIQSYFANYLTSADAGNLLIETYSQSGALAGGNALSALLTPQRLAKIIENVKIKAGFRSI